MFPKSFQILFLITVGVKIEGCLKVFSILSLAHEPGIAGRLCVHITSLAMSPDTHHLTIDGSAASSPFDQLHSVGEAVIYDLTQYFLEERASELWKRGTSRGSSVKKAREQKRPVRSARSIV